MRDALSRIVRRKDYRPPPYTIDRIELEFDLDCRETRVVATSQVRRTCRDGSAPPLELNGQAMSLVSVHVDGRRLTPSQYVLDDEGLTLVEVPERFELRIEGRLNPQENKALEGLYLSQGSLCTQCEAEGFRRITWFLDRPDVMTRFLVTLRADPTRFPVLLANGNRVASGSLADGRHYATWEDPFPKPSYLFALVAGNLTCRTGSFTTRSGKEVTLEVYVDPDGLAQTEHCMSALQKAMAWDEQTFGREYDLETYMIVAVRDFNMGAMENKGLNIFNTKYVLAHPTTATDQDFEHVESVVAHEYFHNWSGNRVTCRDWFQLSLKEGFTVFRDQEFSADVGSRALQRIQDVQRLQSTQFPEDSGPTAHPIRPDHYREISNFYTPTVYEKGAEVVRMIRTLVGPKAFRRGSDLYFERHDGQAVTCEDFVRAMEETSGRDLSQFRLWYSQAGTPEVNAKLTYDPATSSCLLELSQQMAPTPGQPTKSPMLIPIRLGLLNAEGQVLPFSLEQGGEPVEECVLEFCERSQVFRLHGVEQHPVPSLLRNFSAPVVLRYQASDTELLTRISHDTDPFNRWAASQSLTENRIFAAMARDQSGGPQTPLDSDFVDALEAVLRSDSDPALVAETLKLPSEMVLTAKLHQVEPQQLHRARESVRTGLASNLQQAWHAKYEALAGPAGQSVSPNGMGLRSLRHLCLDYLMALDTPWAHDLAWQQFCSARNMTEAIFALAQLCHVPSDLRTRALRSFYEQYASYPLVIDKWFAVQALSQAPDTVERLEELASHPDFDIHNPNRVRSLISSFAQSNPAHFHAPDGRGYQLLADYILRIDRFNPQIAARMATPLGSFGRFVTPLRKQMIDALERIDAEGQLSSDLREQVGRSLDAAADDEHA